MEERELKILNKRFRFDSMNTYELENSNNLFFMYNTTIPKLEKFYSLILFEKDVDNRVLWINNKLIDEIKTFCKLASFAPNDLSLSDQNNIEYFITELEIFFNTNTIIELPNNLGAWNPISLNWNGYEIKIITEYAEIYWERIKSKLKLIE